MNGQAALVTGSSRGIGFGAVSASKVSLLL